jgi:glycosyltransferase involved in cell wall biosynthesis
MSPLEAMAAGKPVIAMAEGGSLETVVHRSTGWCVEVTISPARLFDAVEALEQLEPPSMRTACEERAQLLDQGHFVTRMLHVLVGVPP